MSQMVRYKHQKNESNNVEALEGPRNPIINPYLLVIQQESYNPHVPTFHHLMERSMIQPMKTYINMI